MSKPDNLPDPIITPEFIEIPRFGGQRQKLNLPNGSSELVKQYLQSETLETELDMALSTITKAKKIIADQRKMFMYEIMGRAQQETHVKKKNTDVKTPKKIKDDDSFDDSKPQKKTTKK